MKAFVRFRELPQADDERRRFSAWFEPNQRIEETIAPFFTNRFGDMDWLIETPEASALFKNGKTKLSAQANKKRSAADDIEMLWTTYYANIFNPGRLKINAMTAEMPKKYWRNLPEAALTPSLITSADKCVEDMRQAAPTQPPKYVQKARNQANIKR